MIQYLSILLNANLNRVERGATAVEYGLLIALIAAVIVGVVALLGDDIAGAFDSTNDEIGDHVVD